MNILMVHYKTGGTDGVSLEMDKWRVCFEKMGHKVFYIAGEMDGEIIYDSLYHLSEIAKKFYSYSFQNKLVFKDENEYKNLLNIEVQKCEKILAEFIENNNIDLVIPQNVFSVAMNIAVAIALDNVIKRKKLKVLAQHHDFFWERKTELKYGCEEAKNISEKYLPPKDKKYKHVCINQQGHDTLLKRKQIDSYIIPNVFDFEAKLWEIDNYNNDFKKDFNINEKDILILQATRIVDRKAIELAIDVISKMNEIKDNYYDMKLYDNRIFDKNSNIVLVLAGYDDDDESNTYLFRLLEHAKKKNVILKIIGNRIDHSRAIKDKTKIYSLWDTYVFADIISYPSYWEGWGNQFLEAIFAKKPIIVFEYPVFISDIKNKGFDYISLKSNYSIDNKTRLVTIDDKILADAALNTFEYLLKKDKRKKSVENNFKIGKLNFSITTLYKMLKDILEKI